MKRSGTVTSVFGMNYGLGRGRRAPVPDGFLCNEISNMDQPVSHKEKISSLEGTDSGNSDPSPQSSVLASRYSRQTILPQIGREGQEKLRAATVVIAGIGALGSSIAEMLARAGVGILRLADRDYLELHNLQRQSLYTEA